MASNWGTVLNKYLEDFETRTTAALENINKSLSQSGHTFNDKIKSYIVKSVHNRLEQTLELFDIQNSIACANSKCAKEGSKREANTENDDPIESDTSSGGIEIVENEIKIESISSDDDNAKQAETVTSSYSASSEVEVDAIAEPTQPLAYERTLYRPSLDSNLSDQQSICSPSTSNLPMLGNSPIDTPRSTLNTCPEYIKKEGNDTYRREAIIFDQEKVDECVVKMEDVPTDPRLMSKENELPSTSQHILDRPVTSVESQPLKRPNSESVQSETSKRQKTNDDMQSRGTSAMFVCFYCRNEENLFFETFADLYQHWECNHGALPIRYIPLAKAACFYCDFYDAFPSLKEHHMNEHSEKIFMVVDRENKTKCRLCGKKFPSTEMKSHFESQHKPSNYRDILSPICFSQHEIEQLLCINSSVQSDKPRQIEAFFCDHCHDKKKISEISFINHIEQAAFTFKCSKCVYSGKTIEETVQHEVSTHNLPKDPLKHSKNLMARLERHYYRTKVMFANGVVLYKHNMLDTMFDDRKEFWLFRERFANQKLEKFTRHEQAKQQDVSHQEELEKQQLICRNLRIAGNLPKATDFWKTFLQICEAIGMKNVSMNDIANTFPRSGAIIVEMVERDLKFEILRAWRNTPSDVRSIYLNEVMRREVRISMDNELTPFFLDLKRHAKIAKGKNQIYSYCVTDHGFNVFREKGSKPHIIWSAGELAKLINRI